MKHSSFWTTCPLRSNLSLALNMLMHFIGMAIIRKHLLSWEACPKKIKLPSKQSSYCLKSITSWVNMPRPYLHTLIFWLRIRRSWRLMMCRILWSTTSPVSLVSQTNPSTKLSKLSPNSKILKWLMNITLICHKCTLRTILIWRHMNACVKLMRRR